MRPGYSDGSGPICPDTAQLWAFGAAQFRHEAGYGDADLYGSGFDGSPWIPTDMYGSGFAWTARAGTAGMAWPFVLGLPEVPRDEA